LLTSGRSGIEAYAQRNDISFLLRSIEEIDGLPGHIEPLLARPPFSLEDEIALMKHEAITHLVTKNAGGVGPAKLQAAEQLGLPVFSIAMPLSPHEWTVTSVDDALAWSRKLSTTC